jgi:hypothetical protein
MRTIEEILLKTDELSKRETGNLYFDNGTRYALNNIKDFVLSGMANQFGKSCFEDISIKKLITDLAKKTQLLEIILKKCFESKESD